MTRRWVSLALVLGVATPGLLILAETAAWALGHPALPTLEGWTGPWCHHDPLRTLTVADRLLPVCARCTGLFAGIAVGPVVGLGLPWRGRALLWVTGFALFPMGIGLLAALGEAAGLLGTANPTRLFLGACLTVGPTAMGVVGARILGDALTPAAGSPVARRARGPG